MSSTLQYAIVGTGNIGAILAQRFSDHHVPALWANTRGPETIDVTELSPSITPATLDTALDADVIVLAIPFLQVRELGGRRTDWSGKIVVDTTNAFLVPNSEQILGGRLSSEFNAEAFSGRRGGQVVQPNRRQAARREARTRIWETRGLRGQQQLRGKRGGSRAVHDLGFAPIELGRLDEGGVLIQARNALVLRELYELPSELEKRVEVASAVGRDLTPGTWKIDPVHSSIAFSRSPPDGRQGRSGGSATSPGRSRCPSAELRALRPPSRSGR